MAVVVQEVEGLGLMKISKCQCCKTPVKFGVLRCAVCDRAWQIGYEFGYEVRQTQIQHSFAEILKPGEKSE